MLRELISPVEFFAPTLHLGNSQQIQNKLHPKIRRYYKNNKTTLPNYSFFTLSYSIPGTNQFETRPVKYHLFQKMFVLKWTLLYFFCKNMVNKQGNRNGLSPTNTNLRFYSGRQNIIHGSK